MTFDVECMEDVDKTRVTVEVVGPNSKPAVTLSWHGTTGHGDFTPVETGQHQVQKAKYSKRETRQEIMKLAVTIESHLEYRERFCYFKNAQFLTVIN